MAFKVLLQSGPAIFAAPTNSFKFELFCYDRLSAPMTLLEIVEVLTCVSWVMYYVADKQTAARALIDLRAARFGEHAAILASLQRLRNEVACAGQDDRPRMEAWVSIRKLYDVFKAAPERDLKPFWQDAISKTAAWSESLR